MTDPNDWNFEGAFSTAAGVIPVLLLVLLLEKEVLPVVTATAVRLRGAFDVPPNRLEKIRNAILPTSYLTNRLTVEIVRPSILVGLAVLAEAVALFGVAQPADWRTDGPWRIVAFGSLIFIAAVVLQLLATLFEALYAVARAAEKMQADALRKERSRIILGRTTPKVRTLVPPEN